MEIADGGAASRCSGRALHAARGGVPLGLVEGQSTKLIARELLLSRETLRYRPKTIFAKLGVRSRDDALAEVRRRTLMC